jgi:diguanylate cyclase (GGDEF)-like protein
VANRPDDDLSTLLTAMIQLVHAADRLPDVRETIAHAVRMISQYDALTLREVGISRSLEVTLRRGDPPDSATRALERHLCQEASVAGRAVSTLDRFASEQAQSLIEAYTRRYRLCLVRPLQAYGEPVGVLTLHYAGRTALADSEFDALRRLSESAAVALHNARARQELRDFAHTDPLTGLASRRKLDLELARLQRTGLSLLLVDFDGLKAVNDTLGYARGDELIARIGTALAAHSREGELAARLGGDEFVIVLSKSDERHARRRSDELTAALDQLELPSDLEALFHGASVGAATAAPGESPREVLLRATTEMRSRKRRRKTDREAVSHEQHRFGSA